MILKKFLINLIILMTKEDGQGLKIADKM